MVAVVLINLHGEIAELQFALGKPCPASFKVASGGDMYDGDSSISDREC